MSLFFNLLRHSGSSGRVTQPPDMETDSMENMGAGLCIIYPALWRKRKIFDYLNYLHQVFYWKGDKTGPIHLNFSNDVWEYIVLDSFAWILSRSLDQIFSRYMKAWNLSAKQIDRFNIQCNNCTALVLDVPTDENISCILIWDLNNCRFASHTTWSFWENEMKILKEEQFYIFSKKISNRNTSI